MPLVTHHHPPARAVGKKMLIELVEQDENSGSTWATIVDSSNNKPGVSQDDLLVVEDLDSTNQQDPHHKEAVPLVSIDQPDPHHKEAVPWFEEAGKVPDSVLQEYDTHSAAGEEDKVWNMALKAGSTLEQDEIELDEATKRRLKQRVQDSTSLCF